MLYDKDIREPLFQFLDLKFGKNRILEEKQMGRSRADIIMVLPAQIVGIEIKSDADTYVRLKRQVKDYDTYCDTNYVVIGSTHSSTILKYVPAHWGIISVEDIKSRVDFYILREALPNPHIDRKKKLSILWRPELAHLQSLNAMAAYKQKSKAFVIEKILDKVEPTCLQIQISDVLFERDYTTIADTISAYRVENGRTPLKRKRRRRKARKTL